MANYSLGYSKMRCEKFADFLVKVAGDSLKYEGLTAGDRKKLENASLRLWPFLSRLLEKFSNLSAESCDQSMYDLWEVMADTYSIGSCGTVSDSAKKFIKEQLTLPARKKVALNKKSEDGSVHEAFRRVMRNSDNASKSVIAINRLINAELTAKGIRPLGADTLKKYRDKISLSGSAS